MKTILIAPNQSWVQFDPDTMEIEPVSSDRESISRIHMVNEDCKVKCDGEILEAKAGDILVMFYEHRFKHRVVLVKSEDWAENLRLYREQEQKEKEEYALKECAEKCCDDACPDTCCNLAK